MRTPHLNCTRGKRVIIKLRCGKVIIDKFIERRGRYIVLEHSTIAKRDIASFGIYKERK